MLYIPISCPTGVEANRRAFCLAHRELGRGVRALCGLIGLSPFIKTLLLLIMTISKRQLWNRWST